MIAGKTKDPFLCGFMNMLMGEYSTCFKSGQMSQCTWKLMMHVQSVEQVAGCVTSCAMAGATL